MVVQETKPTTMGANKENTIVLKGASESYPPCMELRPDPVLQYTKTAVVAA